MRRTTPAPMATRCSSSATPTATVVLERFPRSDHYRAQIDAFNASVLDGAPYACPLEFSRGNQVMIDMIYAAAGSPVSADCERRRGSARLEPRAGAASPGPEGRREMTAFNVVRMRVKPGFVDEFLEFLSRAAARRCRG